jgi:streptogramin lyase
MLALLLSISISALPQSAISNVSAESVTQVASMQRSPDPPMTTLIREYLLPVIPLTTIAYLGPARTPFGIVYDSNGYSWVTDIARDAIYQLTPATLVNQTLTTAKEWILPNTEGKRSPLYITANESKKVVWFTDPTSHQISRLNWVTGQLDDWDLVNLNIMPLDLVVQSGSVWFTGMNDTRFFQLVPPNALFIYTMTLKTGFPAAKPTRITSNGTCLFLTDIAFDRLYEIPLPIVPNAMSYPLTHPGFTWDLDVDAGNNVWVTQPLSSLIDEQLAHSSNKSSYQISMYSLTPPSETVTLNTNTLNVTIQITPVTPTAYAGPLNVTGDPFVVWKVPTTVTAVTMVPPPARPWDIAASADGYAWFSEPLYNHVAVIQPGPAPAFTGAILFYTVPTSQSLPLSIDIQSGNPYHVWFTEYRAGQIGELFNATYTVPTPGAPIVITIYGLAIGFAAGFLVMGVAAMLIRKRKG